MLRVGLVRRPRSLTGSVVSRCLSSYPAADAPGGPVDEAHWTQQYRMERLEAAVPRGKVKDLRATERLRFMQLEAFKRDAASSGLKLDVMSSAVVERLPVIMPDLEDWEVDMHELKEEKETYTQKEYPSEFFSFRERPVQKQNLWAYDLLDFGTEGRLGKREINGKLKEELEPMLKEFREEEQARIEEAEKAALEERKKSLRGAAGAASEELTKTAGKSANEASSDDSFDLSADLDLGDQLDVDLSEIEIDIDEDTTQEVEYNLGMDEDEEDPAAKAQAFRPEPRITLEDKIHDTRSLRRRLQRRLHLLVKVPNPEDPNGEPVWRYPSGLRNEDEELYASAQRHVVEQCGDLDLYMLSRIPAGYTWYKYPEAEQKEKNAYGALVMLYRGQRLEGHVEPSNKILDYVWISNDELKQIVPEPESDPYWKYGRLFMDD